VGVPGAGPVSVDELYVGVGDFGPPRIVPVMIQRLDEPIDGQRLRAVEAFCRHHYPDLSPRLVAVQFKADEDGKVVVIFQLVHNDDRVRLANEKQYRIGAAGSVR
jgi:hypothetical protein